ncbi:MAG: GTPase Era [Bacteroidales bacterium]|jgi:GTP-binding protein Era|nr:GTPase Era [Bacteroidales bacterium]
MNQNEDLISPNEDLSSQNEDLTSQNEDLTSQNEDLSSPNEPKTTHKAGFVNIIGNPNVGKSTLMNALVGEKLCITTQKSQTTRHRIMGMVNGDDYQVVYSDTPGLVHPHHKLHQSMMAFVGEALRDADIFLVITELGESFKNDETLQYIIQSTIPIILVVNKIDLSSQDVVKEKLDYWQSVIPRAQVLPCSAITGFGVERIFDTILQMLPLSPPYFEKQQLTDKSLRFFAAEIIREKLLLFYDKEIPYCCEVTIEQYEETPTLDRISAVIYVERESQKRILIGHNGTSMKRVGISARQDLEAFVGKQCYISLFVKVSDSWRNNDKTLHRFGYN